MRRGEIWWVAFDPALGGEIRKTRPAVIVSNDAACLHQNRLQVVPVSSRVTSIRRWESPLIVDGRPCKALADQVRTVAKERLASRIGEASPSEMSGIEAALRLQLDL
ncbi:MAG: type II toxin-antitoxin system PemK/MazF family toxin [Parvibaculaceae bacterium]